MSDKEIIVALTEALECFVAAEKEYREDDQALIAALVNALEVNSTVAYTDGTRCWCVLPPHKADSDHSLWCVKARAAMELAKDHK